MAIVKVVKRDGSTIVDFDENKIRNAIKKANHDVPSEDQADDVLIDKIIYQINHHSEYSLPMDVESLQNFIENCLMSHEKYALARAYITYRYKRELVRKANTTDESILTLINGTNVEVMKENSNKKPGINSTQRDLISGEVSKDISRRFLLPSDIVKAHDDGEIHFHK